MRNMSNPTEGVPQDILPEIDPDMLLEYLGPVTQDSGLSIPGSSNPHLEFHLPNPDPRYQPPTQSTPAVLVPRGTAPQSSSSVSELYPGTVSITPPSRDRPRQAVSRCSQGMQGNAQRGWLTAQTKGQAQARTEAEPESPVLVIVEEPKMRGMRFRYECEGRSAGSIPGASSTEKNKTLPTIEIQGNLSHVKGIKVIVSLVTKDVPYRPHPHCLVGKGCNEGICVVYVDPKISRKHSFANLGIQCVRRKEMDAALERRRDQNIDPFNTGHTKSIEDVDMNVVRLCFQWEMERQDGEKVTMGPVVSNPIYDNKATITSELKIYRLNVDRGPCTGKTEIYMLCDKVQKDDIEIIFSHEGWEARAEFAQTDVHRQIAVIFKSPPYQELDISEEVEVNVTLHRLSDRMDSEAVKFTYLPHNPDPYEINRKRKIASARSFASNRPVSNLTLPEPSSSHLFESFVLPLPEGAGPTAAALPEQPPLTMPFAVEMACADLLAQTSPEEQSLLFNIISIQERLSSDLSFGQYEQQNGCSDYTFPYTDLKFPNADLLLLNADLPLLNADLLLPNADVMPPNAEGMFPDASNTFPNTDVTLPDSDVTLSNADVTLSNADVTLADSDITLPNVDLSH